MVAIQDIWLRERHAQDAAVPMELVDTVAAVCYAMAQRNALTRWTQQWASLVRILDEQDDEEACLEFEL